MGRLKQLKDAEWLAGIVGLSVIILVVVIVYWGWKGGTLAGIGLIALWLFHLVIAGAMFTEWLETRNAPPDKTSAEHQNK